MRYIIVDYGSNPTHRPWFWQRGGPWTQQRSYATEYDSRQDAEMAVEVLRDEGDFPHARVVRADEEPR